MADPYKTLGLELDADEATVRRRYLELVRQFPPEKEPQRFADIRQAYDELRDPATRLQKQIFDAHPTDSLSDIIADVQASARSTRIPTETLLSMSEG